MNNVQFKHDYSFKICFDFKGKLKQILNKFKLSIKRDFLSNGNTFLQISLMNFDIINN